MTALRTNEKNHCSGVCLQVNFMIFLWTAWCLVVVNENWVVLKRKGDDVWCDVILPRLHYNFINWNKFLVFVKADVATDEKSAEMQRVIYFIVIFILVFKLLLWTTIVIHQHKTLFRATLKVCRNSCSITPETNLIIFIFHWLL